MIVTKKSNSTLVTSSVSWEDTCGRRTTADVFSALAAAAAAGVVAVGKWKNNVQCVALFSPRGPLLPFLPFSLRPFLSHAFPARALVAARHTLFDGLAPSVSVGRCPYGPTKRLSTMSCVYSTHHFLALKSLPSSLQCISLALPFSIVPFLGLNFSFFSSFPLSFSISRVTFLLTLSTHFFLLLLLSLHSIFSLFLRFCFPLLLLLSPCLFQLLLRSPLFLSRLLRSPLFLFLPFVFAFFSLL